MKKLMIAALAMLACITGFAQNNSNQAELDLPEVYRDKNVVFWKLDNNTWIGSGNMVSSETLYLIEGEDKAVLIDAGTRIPNLDKIVRRITKKPVSLLLTHGHGDHVGAAGCFDELWMNTADEGMLRNYKGTIHHIENGQKFDLGGRVLEAFYTPGHTLGSITFLEVGTEKGYSGDAYGSTNLLVNTDIEVVMNTCEESLKYYKENGYKYFYCGHYWGNNLETLERIEEIRQISEDVLSGKVDGEPAGRGGMGLNRVVTRNGFKFNYSDKEIERQRFNYAYEAVSANDFDENIFNLVGKDFTVITAGDKPNSMVASWGGVGIMFNKPVTWNFLRANRFTLEKMRKTGTFTMCYFSDQYKGDVMQFGIKSGRNTDKMAQTKLTPMNTPDGYPAYKEAKIIIECKLIAASTVSKDEFYTEEAKTFLQEGFDDAKDWHKLVYGEITNIYVRK